MEWKYQVSIALSFLLLQLANSIDPTRRAKLCLFVTFVTEAQKDTKTRWIDGWMDVKIDCFNKLIYFYCEAPGLTVCIVAVAAHAC